MEKIKERIWTALGFVCIVVLGLAFWEVVRFIMWWCYDMGFQM